jgi:tetratricopeptide (TPR) repeat protein
VLAPLLPPAGGDPIPFTDAIRAEIFQDLRRYDEAVLLSRDMIRREPENPKWDKFHSELPYRPRHADYLKSDDTAPTTTDLFLSKAFFLSHEKRAAEALDAYTRPAALEPDNRRAAAGVAFSMAMLGQHGEAVAALERILATEKKTPSSTVAPQKPRPDRLVLFPSYMWHGTIPFHDAQPRTTIAFDVVPKT